MMMIDHNLIQLINDVQQKTVKSIDCCCLLGYNDDVVVRLNPNDDDVCCYVII